MWLRLYLCVVKFVAEKAFMLIVSVKTNLL